MPRKSYYDMEFEELTVILKDKSEELKMIETKAKYEPSLQLLGRQVQLIKELAEVFEATGYKMLEMSDVLKGNLRRS